MVGKAPPHPQPTEPSLLSVALSSHSLPTWKHFYQLCQEASERSLLPPWQTPAHHSASSSTAPSAGALASPSDPQQPSRPTGNQHCTAHQSTCYLGVTVHQSVSSWRTALGVFIFRCPAVFGTKQILNKCLRRNKQKNEELWKYFSNNSIRKTHTHARTNTKRQREK